MNLPRLRGKKKTVGWGRWFCAPILSYYLNGGFEKSEPPFLCACRPMTTCRDTVADWRLFCRVHFIISLFAWSAPAKKSVAPPSEQSGFEYHGISKLTIAKMADVEEQDIDRLLANPPEKVEIEVKYKIAVTVMELRFWLKDCELPI